MNRNACTGWAAFLLLAIACGAGPSGLGGSSAAQRQVARGDLSGAAQSLEAARIRSPRSVRTRLELGEVYYLTARQALDRDQDEARYLDYLARSLDEFVTAVELDPRNPGPHTYLAAIDLYQGDLPGTFRSLNNARRLAPDGVSYSNIAEAYVYQGRPERAREWNDLALRKNAPYGAVQFNDMLIAWSEGDLRLAQDRFARVKRHYPEMIERMHMAPLPEEPRSFEEFAANCCASPACGPYMQAQCDDLSLEVADPTVSEETTLRALQLEIEKQRRLRKVYEQRKELEIDIGE